MVNKIEIGQKFGRWTVIQPSECPSHRKGPNKNKWYLCRCECGIERVIPATKLTTGWSTQCGRHKKEHESIESRFNKFVIKKEGCWGWSGFKANGYPKLNRKKPKSSLASHVSWEIHNGEIPNDMCVLHKCDNPECCNPSHLFLGTRTDNNRDRDEKGRTVHLKGERVATSKFTENEVKEIIILHKSKSMKVNDIAKKFGTTPSYVSSLSNGKSWKHIDRKQLLKEIGGGIPPSS